MGEKNSPLLELGTLFVDLYVVRVDVPSLSRETSLPAAAADPAAAV